MVEGRAFQLLSDLLAPFATVDGGFVLQDPAPAALAVALAEFTRSESTFGVEEDHQIATLLRFAFSAVVGGDESALRAAAGAITHSTKAERVARLPGIERIRHLFAISFYAFRQTPVVEADVRAVHGTACSLFEDRGTRRGFERRLGKLIRAARLLSNGRYAPLEAARRFVEHVLDAFEIRRRYTADLEAVVKQWSEIGFSTESLGRGSVRIVDRPTVICEPVGFALQSALRTIEAARPGAAAGHLGAQKDVIEDLRVVVEGILAAYEHATVPGSISDPSFKTEALQTMNRLAGIAGTYLEKSGYPQLSRSKIGKILRLIGRVEQIVARTSPPSLITIREIVDAFLDSFPEFDIDSNSKPARGIPIDVWRAKTERERRKLEAADSAEVARRLAEVLRAGWNEPRQTALKSRAKAAWLIREIGYCCGRPKLAKDLLNDPGLEHERDEILAAGL